MKENPMKIKRLDVSIDRSYDDREFGPLLEIIVCEDGSYVRWEDVQKLQDEIRNLVGLIRQTFAYTTDSGEYHYDRFIRSNTAFRALINASEYYKSIGE